MSKKKHTILVVDDEEDFRFILRDHFEDRGYEVAEAADGVEALEVFDSRPVDLVLTDIRMPRMSGEELIVELRRKRPFLPIIGVTGHADLSGRLSLLDQGAYYYLDKPLPHWPIVDRLIDNAIRLHHHEEELERKRAKEIDIARLLRGHVLESTRTQLPPAGDGETRAIELDIRLWYVESDRPAGDYAEWFKRNEHEIVFYLADASGHDDLLSSFVSCLASLVIHRAHHGATPEVDALILELDQALGELRQAGALGQERYLTFFLGILDLTTGEMRYINAGHPDAFVLRNRGGKIRSERLASNSRPVGFLFGQPPEIGRTRLAPDEVLFAYTDGASDLFENGAAGVDLLAAEVERLAAVPEVDPAKDPAAKGSAAARLVHGVAELLEEKAGSKGFPDDTTLLALAVQNASGTA